jgi:hypothetical protein
MASSVIEPIGRAGFAARGVVYVTVGVLAAKAAIGARGGRTTDPEGAVREIGRASEVLLLMVAAGLVGYAVWRFAQAWYDLDRKGSGLKGLAVRASYVASGVLHLGVALTAFGLGRRGGGLRAWVAEFLREPGGVWAVGIAGACVVGSGVFQFYKAWKAKFEEHQRTGQMSSRERRWARRVGRFGLCARGVTFVIVGYFLVQAAWHVNARVARDVAGALRTLQQQPYGAWLLGVVALGLVAYGLLSFVDARYRRIVAPGARPAF